MLALFWSDRSFLTCGKNGVLKIVCNGRFQNGLGYASSYPSSKEGLRAEKLMNRRRVIYPFTIAWPRYFFYEATSTFKARCCSVPLLNTLLSPSTSRMVMFAGKNQHSFI